MASSSVFSQGTSAIDERDTDSVVEASTLDERVNFSIPVLEMVAENERVVVGADMARNRRK